MTLGERLRIARERKGWNQKYVADKLSISGSVLSGYERDYREPDNKTMVRLAKIYNVSMDWLSGATEDFSNLEDRCFYVHHTHFSPKYAVFTHVE